MVVVGVEEGAGRSGRRWVVAVETETEVGYVCCCNCDGVGEMSKVVMVLASAVRSDSGELMVVSVLCSKRQVSEGLVRPCWRLMTIA